VQLGLFATDGSKLPGNASRHKAMSYGYMKKEQERLKAEILDLLAQARQARAWRRPARGTPSGWGRAPGG